MDIETTIGRFVTNVTVADADTAGFVVDVALRVTIWLGGAVEGLR